MFFLDKISQTKKLLLKTTMVTTMASSLIAFSNGPVAFADSSESSKDYHVYLEGTYIGNVTDKNVVNKIIAEKAIDNDIMQQIQDVPYQVFPTAETETETVQTIRNIFQLQTEASAIVIEGKPVAYVENQTK